MRSRVFAALAALSVLTSPAAAAPVFRDATEASGLDFVHSNGATGDKQYIEVMGSGGAALDFDGDGRLDLYLVSSVGSNRLYRNLGGLRFEDVTEAAGVGDEGYGMGAVSADVDGDGDADLFVTNFGANVFYRNRGDGTFENVAAELGTDDARWSCGASFLDYDHDGRLDLYVVNYVQVAVPDTNVCRAAGGTRLYCPPRAYPRESDALLRQRPDGTFEDVTAAAGLGAPRRGLGVITTDFDQDGWTDLYVANDLDPNSLFRNLGDGTFEDVGVFAGVSHSEDGRAESGMGVDAGDVDRDGRPDLFVSNYVDETNTLYLNDGAGFFLDESARSGLGPSSLRWVGWGTGFLDYDADGWLDLLVVNGHTESDATLVDPSTSWKQPGLLYRNLGDGSFEDVTQSAAPALADPRPSRGAIFADLDDDGDIDVVVIAQNERLLLLENTAQRTKRWIGLHLRGTPPNRDALGARIEVHTGGRVTSAESRAGGSYLCGNDPRLLFSFPPGEAPDSLIVRWPDGEIETFTDLDPGRYHRLRQGGQ